MKYIANVLNYWNVISTAVFLWTIGLVHSTQTFNVQNMCFASFTNSMYFIFCSAKETSVQCRKIEVVLFFKWKAPIGVWKYSTKTVMSWFIRSCMLWNRLNYFKALKMALNYTYFNVYSPYTPQWQYITKIMFMGLKKHPTCSHYVFHGETQPRKVARKSNGWSSSD